MIAVDTNVLVRLLTGDDPKQAALAKSLFSAGPIWIAKTVLLETSWVLQSLYGFEESAIRDALVNLVSLQNVRVEDQTSVVTALALTEHGLQLADAMHLRSRLAGAIFASFDQAFIQRGKRAGVLGISGVPVKK